MTKRECKIDLDTLDDLTDMLEEWWDEKKDGMYYAQDKRHKLEDRKERIRWLFRDSQHAERVRRFLTQCVVVYESNDDAIISTPYEASTRLSLDYFRPCNDARNIAKECGLEDYYDELLEDIENGES